MSQKPSGTRGRGGVDKTIDEFSFLSDIEDATQIPEFLKRLSLYGDFNSYNSSRSEDEAVMALLSLNSCDLIEVGAKSLPSCCLREVKEDTDKSTQGFEVVQVIGLGLRLKEMM
jgi:hypothetical protein